MKTGLVLLLVLFTSTIFAATGKPIKAKHAMVVTSHYLATQAGVEILKKGGNAIDAAVAVGYALAVVEPCCGNLGGGGFLLLRKNDGNSYFLNFREKAPSKLKPNLFIHNDGTINEKKLTNSYLAVGIPGTVMGLNSALHKFGTLPLSEVMAPAIRLAKQGFILDSTNARQFQMMHSNFINDPNLKRNFTHQGKSYIEGELFKQPELAHTLELIASKGTSAFYQGEITKKIVKSSSENGGVMTFQDFKNYHIEWKQPLSCHYHGYTILTAPLPSSGGITVCEMLAILENYALSDYGFHSTQASHYMLESMRYAYADRIADLGDPDFVPDVTQQLLSSNHIKTIVNLIQPNKKSAIAVCKSPIVSQKMHTTHYSIVDTQGNAVAVTYTINDFFGSKISAQDTGFLLNDEIDDFTIIPNQPNHPHSIAGSKANILAPNKRPLSSTAPTIVVKNGKTILVTGSPGGATIPTTVLQVIINLFDFDQDIQMAVNAPRFHNQCIPDLVYWEPDAFSDEVVVNLKQQGYLLHLYGPFNNQPWGAAESIWKDPTNGYLYGANDVRRPNGLASGY